MPSSTPLDREPRPDLVEAAEMLRIGLRHVGPLGAWDERIGAWVASWDQGTVATVASWLRRAWEQGLAAAAAASVGGEAGLASAVEAVLATDQAEARTCGVAGYVCVACGVRYGGRIHDCHHVDDAVSALTSARRADLDSVCHACGSRPIHPSSHVLCSECLAEMHEEPRDDEGHVSALEGDVCQECGLAFALHGDAICAECLYQADQDDDATGGTR